MVIPDAEVKRFIELQFGLPYSMIRVTYTGEGRSELGQALTSNTVIPFDCDTLKTRVMIQSSSQNSETDKHEYVLMEPAADVPSGYILIHTKVGNEKAILVPENADKSKVDEFRKLPYFRLISKKDVT